MIYGIIALGGILCGLGYETFQLWKQNKRLKEKMKALSDDGRQHGHYLILDRDSVNGGKYITKCSVCGQKLSWFNLTLHPAWWGKYCRNCGSLMDEPMEDKRKNSQTT